MGARPRFKDRVGYCRHCHSETIHFRFVEPLILRTFDLVTLGMLGHFGVGPWHCSDCYQTSWWMRGYRPRSRDAEYEAELVDGAEAQPIGNFERTQYSLVSQTERTERFSKNFRRDVVNRLLDGSVTVSDLTRELNIYESDLILWIAHEFRDQREALESQIRRLHALLQEEFQDFLECDLIGIHDVEPLSNGSSLKRSRSKDANSEPPPHRTS